MGDTEWGADGKSVFSNSIHIAVQQPQWPNVPGHLRALAASDAMSPRYSARQVPSRGQYTVIGVLTVVLLAFLAWRPEQTVYTVGFGLWVAFFLIVIWRLGLVAAGAVLRKVRPPSVTPPRAPTQEWPVYSVLVALRHEVGMMNQLANSLRGLDWPADRLEIILLIEDDDDATLDAARIAPFPGSTRILRVPPGSPTTKPRALNYGLAHATGTYVTIYDAEDRPHRDQLKAAYHAFEEGPADLRCIQAPLIATNGASSWLAAQWALEYAVQFRLYLPALAMLGHPIMLGGTSNHFRRADLIAVGGWDAWNVTEDADLGIRASRLGGRTQTIAPETLESAPETFGIWFRQRSRWIKGYMQTWLVCMREPIRLVRELGIINWISLQMTLGASILSALLYGPTSVWILCAVLFSDVTIDPMGVGLFGFGWVCSTLSDLLAPGRWRFSRLLAAFSRPFYWPLQTLAAIAAIHGLVRNPFFWAKTPHQPE
ncbi:MAG: glycosyltransferase [Pseudomonadota bacterium]|nr:glycosyltransferase [Pseudomonadota bacterium]